MRHVTIDWDIIQPAAREVITAVIKEHCDNYGIA